MISDVKNHPISFLFDIESKVAYNIPRYQREYTWSRNNWEAIFDDVTECGSAYFMGSIICVNQSRDALGVQELELIDGQQRITTISLLFLALYALLKVREADLDDEQRVELINLKNRLVLKRIDRIRVNPQHQNSNNDDYRAILASVGLIKSAPKPRNAGNRRIYKCFHYFKDRIEERIHKDQSNVEGLLELLTQFLSVTMVMIQVESHSDAYVLFESLNNRGVPLSPIDIIKNKLLAEIERRKKDSLEDSFNSWKELLEYLGDNYGVQERFFRQYYNGFKGELVAVVDVSVATKTNLILIYEKLIHNNPENFLNHILTVGKHASLVLGRCTDEKLASRFQQLHGLFLSMERIQSAPSYLLLMNLLRYHEKYELTNVHFDAIIKQIISFFVRRAVTEIPPTYELTRLFMSITETIAKTHRSDWAAIPLKASAIVNVVLSRLKAESANDTDFEKRLKGSLYEENTGATRFILCAIEESKFTKETSRDLWKYEGKQFAFTIEHIFPQGEKIPLTWANMIAEGNMEKAKVLQDAHVHRLGNLTLSGYNSALGNKGFIEKRDRKKDEKFVGYKNGLSLNKELAEMDAWSIERIERRTDEICKKAMSLFTMRDGDFQ